MNPGFIEFYGEALIASIRWPDALVHVAAVVDEKFGRHELRGSGAVFLRLRKNDVVGAHEYKGAVPLRVERGLAETRLVRVNEYRQELTHSGLGLESGDTVGDGLF